MSNTDSDEAAPDADADADASKRESEPASESTPEPDTASEETNEDTARADEPTAGDEPGAGADAASGANSDRDSNADPEIETPVPRDQLRSMVPDEITGPDEIPEDRREQVAAEPATAARLLAGLVTAHEELTETLDGARERADDLESRLARKQAEFQNYKKRQERELEREKARATEALVERIVDVRDDLARALDQDADVDIRDGVATTLEKFDRELERENVEQISPETGESTDPTRHEVLASVAADLPEGRIANVHRPGYEMAGKVIQPAQVTVSDGSGTAGSEDGSDTGTERPPADTDGPNSDGDGSADTDPGAEASEPGA